MEPKERKNLMVFGYGLAVIITFITYRLVMKHGISIGKLAAFWAAVILIFVTTFYLEKLRPVYKVWMKGAHLIGGVVSFTALSVIFLLFFSLPGLVLRLLRKDLLDEKIDKNAASYWKSLPPKDFDRDSYKNQY